jgi:molybdopterin molybdotransferase
MSDTTLLPEVPVLGFAAFSGTGKTTLLEALIPELVKYGIRVGVYKHSHHDVELDKPGKDSYRLRHAGAYQTMLATPKRSVLTSETAVVTMDFYQLLHQFDTEQIDIILVEGCKEKHLPKIELHRHETGRPWLYLADPDIMAIATDVPVQAPIPCMDLNDIERIADFVRQFIQDFRRDLPCGSF